MDRETAETLKLLREIPALTDPSWLPTDSGIEWLDDLGRDHRRLLAAQSSVISERAELVGRFEREDEERREALSASLRAGREADVTAPTPREQRSALIADVDERIRAVQEALAGFVRDAIRTFEERAPEWLAEIAALRDEATEKRREAQRLLAEADAEEARSWRLEQWVKRNSGTHERKAFRDVPDFRFVTWQFAVENLNRPSEPSAEEVLRALAPH